MDRVTEISDDGNNENTETISTAKADIIEGYRQACTYADILIRRLLQMGAKETWRRDHIRQSQPVAFVANDACLSITNSSDVTRKRIMKGFAGTVNKETTPTVDETLALLKLQELSDANLESSSSVAVDGKSKDSINDSTSPSYYETDDGAQIFSTGG